MNHATHAARCTPYRSPSHDSFTRNPRATAAGTDWVSGPKRIGVNSASTWRPRLTDNRQTAVIEHVDRHVVAAHRGVCAVRLHPAAVRPLIQTDSSARVLCGDGTDIDLAERRCAGIRAVEQFRTRRRDEKDVERLIALEDVRDVELAFRRWKQSEVLVDEPAAARHAVVVRLRHHDGVVKAKATRVTE